MRIITLDSAIREISLITLDKRLYRSTILVPRVRDQERARKAVVLSHNSNNNQNDQNNDKEE
jgi:hypothetical protein